MNIAQLETLFTVGKMRSISEAARVLHLTQPALSMQIQTLEEQLGVELLKRSNRGVELTEAGQIVFDYAATFLRLYQNLQRDLDCWRNEKIQPLVIGASTTLGSYALPCSLYNFKQAHPEVTVRLMVMNSREVLQSLHDKTIALGFIEGKATDRGIITEEITEGEIVLVGPVPFRWSEKRPLQMDDLRTLPLLLREKGSGSRAIIEELLFNKGLSVEQLQVIMELNSVDAIKSAVAAGRGVALLPRLTVTKEVRAGVLQIVPLADFEARYPLTLVYLKDKKFTPCEEKFIQFIRSPLTRGFC